MGKIVSGENEFTIGSSWADGQYLKLDTGAIVSAAVSGTGGGGATFDTQANIPTAGTPGALFLPSDGYLLQGDSGAAWFAYPIHSFKCTAPPAVSSLTAVNSIAQNTLTERGDKTLSVLQVGAGGSSTYNTAYLTALPGGNYTFTVGVKLNFLRPNNNTYCGITLADGTNAASSKLVPFLFNNTSSIPNIALQKWNTVTSWSADYIKEGYSTTTLPFLFMQFVDDGTYRYYKLSGDGVLFHTIYRQSRTDFCTPTHAGLFFGHNGYTLDSYRSALHMTIFHWSLG